MVISVSGNSHGTIELPLFQNGNFDVGNHPPGGGVQ